METNNTIKKPPFPELRAWMEQRGMLQQELARVLQVAGASVSDYLAGKTPWPLEIAIKVSVLTEVPVEKFVNRDVARLLKLLGERSTTPPAEHKDSSSVA
jgi:transcriptional regulator with XRE-family HTH domain